MPPWWRHVPPRGHLQYAAVVPASAAGAPPAQPKTRVWGVDLLGLPRVGLPAAVFPDRRWRNSPSYDDIASGSTQFLSRHPAVAITREPYAYVGGTPLNDSGPTGLGGGASALGLQQCRLRKDHPCREDNTGIDLIQHLTVSWGGCLIVCVNISVQGFRHGSFSLGGIGFFEKGFAVGYANEPACDRQSDSLIVGGGYGVGVAGSEGLHDNTTDPNDWEVDVSGPSLGGFIGAQHSWTLF